MTPGCSIPCPWDALAPPSSCKQSPTHLNTLCVHHLGVYPGPTLAATLLPPLWRHQATQNPTATGTLAQVHTATSQSNTPLLGPNKHSWPGGPTHAPVDQLCRTRSALPHVQESHYHTRGLDFWATGNQSWPCGTSACNNHPNMLTLAYSTPCLWDTLACRNDIDIVRASTQSVQPLVFP